MIAFILLWVGLGILFSSMTFDIFRKDLEVWELLVMLDRKDECHS